MGRLVHVSEVESGLHQDCLCAACDLPLVARKGETGRAEHFAHHLKSPCNAETALHKLGKLILAERINAAVAAAASIPISWDCPRCEGAHSGNLVKRAKSVLVEVRMGERTPDLTLVDNHGRACGIIEIVVSHEPAPGARAFYRDRSLHLIEFHITDGADLLELRDAAELKPFYVTVCPVPAWKLNLVTFVGTPMRLDEVDIEVAGAELRVRGQGDDAPQGTFYFDTPQLAAAALQRLKDGTLDVLCDPRTWLEGVCSPTDINKATIEFRQLGLREYRWNFCGINRYHWVRGRGNVGW